MTTDTLAKLAACPFCGDEPRMSEDDRGFDHVYCYGCGASGPSHETQAEAATTWSRRALTAQALTDAQIEAVFERHKGAPGRELRVTIGRALLSEAGAAQALPAAEPNLAPGVMHCAKCKFKLIRNNLNINAGTITAGNSKTEPCPNGCGPLWPVTWEQEARDAYKTAEDMFDRWQAAQQAAQAPEGPDVDDLAQFIRQIDGNHTMGAGALAERIVEWLAARPQAEGA